MLLLGGLLQRGGPRAQCRRRAPSDSAAAAAAEPASEGPPASTVSSDRVTAMSPEKRWLGCRLHNGLTGTPVSLRCCVGMCNSEHQHPDVGIEQPASVLIFLNMSS